MQPPGRRAPRSPPLRRGERGASSCGIPPRDRCPEQREVRVQVERATQPETTLRVVAEAALDHAAVELLERVARPEPESALREAQRLTAVAGPRERPSQDVVTVDRRPLAMREPREGEHARAADAVVDVEEGGLEVCLDAVRHEQALDDADQ